VDYHLQLAVDRIKALFSQIDSFPLPEVSEHDPLDMNAQSEEDTINIIRENLADLKNRTMLLQSTIDPEFDMDDDIVVHNPGG